MVQTQPNCHGQGPYQQHVLLGLDHLLLVYGAGPGAAEAVGDDGVEAGRQLLQLLARQRLLLQSRLNGLQGLKALGNLLLAKLPQWHLLHVWGRQTGMGRGDKQWRA